MSARRCRAQPTDLTVVISIPPVPVLDYRRDHHRLGARMRFSTICPIFDGYMKVVPRGAVQAALVDYVKHARTRPHSSACISARPQALGHRPFSMRVSTPGGAFAASS
jgi:hypothetical protein